MDLSFNLATSYRYLKDPTIRQNFEDTPGQIPKLILTLRRILTLTPIYACVDQDQTPDDRRQWYKHFAPDNATFPQPYVDYGSYYCLLLATICTSFITFQK